MKIKTILLIGTLAAVGMFDVKAGAEGYAAFSAIAGAVKTFGDLVQGEATVTPTYGLYTWDFYDRYTDVESEEVHIERDKVRYDRFSGYYFFDHFAQIGTNAPTKQKVSFTIPSTALWNYNCDSGFYDPETLQQTYTLWVKISVVTSGLLPPDPPYDVTLKSIGTKLPNSCDDTNYGWTKEFYKQFGMSPIGLTTVTIGHPNFDITYPMDCYAGYFYSHK